MRDAEFGAGRTGERRIGECARQRASARTPIEMGRRRPAEPDAEAVFSAARDEINSRFEVAPKLERVRALIGPPGSHLVARGDVVTVQGSYAVRITEIRENRSGGHTECCEEPRP
jgi:hypothetical protein